MSDHCAVLHGKIFEENEWRFRTDVTGHVTFCPYNDEGAKTIASLNVTTMHKILFTAGSKIRYMFSLERHEGMRIYLYRKI